MAEVVRRDETLGIWSVELMGFAPGLGMGVRESTMQPRHDSSAPADGAAMSPGSRKTGRRS